MARLGWRGALGFALSAALLVWALWGIDFAEVSRSLARVDVPLLALSAAVATLTFPLRALRWRVILAPVVEHPPFAPLWRSTAIGVMVNNVLPARAGELARAFAVSRELPRVPFTAAIASLAVDRVFDAVVLLALMLAATLDPAFRTSTQLGAWTGVAAALVVALLAALYLVVFFPQPIVALFAGLARRTVPRLEGRVRSALLAFASGLGVLRRPGRFAAVLAWTLVHWLVNALAFWIGFVAVGIDVPPTAALFLQGVIGFGVAVPSAPGFFGTFELSAIVGLAAYGVTKSAAVTWAIGFHVLSFVPITAIGAWYFARLGLHFSDLGGAPPTGGPPRSDAEPPREGVSPAAAGRRV